MHISEHAEAYRRAPESVRGLLNFNHPNLLRAVVSEAGLIVSDRSYLREAGFLKLLTIKPWDAANEPGCAPFTLTLHELRQLQIEINTALEGTRRVGQINPRNPGLINNAIQLWKKVMRRTLTWYYAASPPLPRRRDPRTGADFRHSRQSQ